MLQYFFHTGKYIGMLRAMISRPESWQMYWKETIRQMNNIGVTSLPIIGVISFFVGAVSALQFAYQLSGSLFPMYMLGYIIRDIMIIELAPTLSCLVLAGKVASNIASELGSMRISQQIDALETMGVNSISYLVAPKIIAGVVIVPTLVILSAFLGIGGGMLAAENYGIAPALFERGMHYLFEPFNVFIMEIKAVVFAFIMTSVACYQGYFVQGGALEIGQASTRAVVIADSLIIIADYVIASLLT